MSKEEKEVFGTKEWAESNHNIQFGCENNCLYCYARAMAPRHKKVAIWHQPVLSEKGVNANFGKRKGTIMFPTTHDITENNIDNCSKILERMLFKGNRVLIVSKPKLDCVKRLCKDLKNFKDLILFRFTIGSANNETLKFWEPDAPSFIERFDSVRLAKAFGFDTSVSCEPMLDNNIEEVVEKLLPSVTDAIWIGKANKLRTRLKINKEWNPIVQARAEQLLAWQADRYIIPLYEKYKDNPKIKWKESIKKVVGLKIPTKAGLDI